MAPPVPVDGVGSPLLDCDGLLDTAGSPVRSLRWQLDTFPVDDVVRLRRVVSER